MDWRDFWHGGLFLVDLPLFLVKSKIGGHSRSRDLEIGGNFKMYSLTHVGCLFLGFFWGGEFEFGDDLMLRSQLRSLTLSNDLP